MHIKVLCLEADRFTLFVDDAICTPVKRFTAERMVKVFPIGESRNAAEQFVRLATSGNMIDIPWPEGKVLPNVDKKLTCKRKQSTSF